MARRAATYGSTRTTMAWRLAIIFVVPPALTCLLLLALAPQGEAARRLTQGDVSENTVQSSSMALGASASVNIIQEIGDTPITVHCSGDGQDLGSHVLIKHLQQFGWGFTPNKFGTTLYQCSFSWLTRHQSFVVWRNNVAAPIPCVHCVYHMRPDGFYRAEQGGPLVFVTGW